MRKLLLVAFLLYAQPAVACGTDVLIFDAWWCVHCKNVKSYLTSRGINYRTIDTTQNKYHWLDVMLVNFGSAGIPVTVIDGRWDGTRLISSHSIITGFNPAAMRQALCIY